MLRFLAESLIVVSLLACSSRNRIVHPAIASSRIKTVRPGEGVQLDDNLARLLIAGKRVQAMRKCNHILFSSRSPIDRETASFWKAVIITLEEMEESHYKKAGETMRDGSKWLNSPHKKYHSTLIIKLIDDIREKRLALQALKKEIANQGSLRELKTQNRSLSNKIEELRRQNAKLEKLIRDLEDVK